VRQNVAVWTTVAGILANEDTSIKPADNQSAATAGEE
jgi:hypothetical protein